MKWALLIGFGVLSGCSLQSGLPNENQVELATRGALSSLRAYDDVEVTVLSSKCARSAKDVAWCPVCYIVVPKGNPDSVVATFRAQMFIRKGEIWGFENSSHGEQKGRWTDAGPAARSAAAEFCQDRFEAMSDT